MKCFVLVLLFLTFVSSDEDKYSTKYDNVNIDNILSNYRLTTNYIKCLLDKGKCNEDGKALKDVIPDALTTDCSKCNEKQKANAEKVLEHLIKNRKKDWDDLIAKYDPDGKYVEKYKKYIEKWSSK